MQDIINSSSFLAIFTVLRLAYSDMFINKHKDIPLITLREHVAKLAYNEPLDPDEFMRALNEILTTIEKEIPRSWHVNQADISWFSKQIHDKHVPALLVGYAESPGYDWISINRHS